MHVTLHEETNTEPLKQRAMEGDGPTCVADLVFPREQSKFSSIAPSRYRLGGRMHRFIRGIRGSTASNRNIRLEINSNAVRGDSSKGDDVSVSTSNALEGFEDPTEVSEASYTVHDRQQNTHKGCSECLVVSSHTGCPPNENTCAKGHAKVCDALHRNCSGATSWSTGSTRLSTEPSYSDSGPLAEMPVEHEHSAQDEMYKNVHQSTTCCPQDMNALSKGVLLHSQTPPLDATHFTLSGGGLKYAPYRTLTDGNTECAETTSPSTRNSTRTRDMCSMSTPTHSGKWSPDTVSNSVSLLSLRCPPSNTMAAVAIKHQEDKIESSSVDTHRCCKSHPCDYPSHYVLNQTGSLPQVSTSCETRNNLYSQTVTFPNGYKDSASIIPTLCNKQRDIQRRDACQSIVAVSYERPYPGIARQCLVTHNQPSQYRGDAFFSQDAYEPTHDSAKGHAHPYRLKHDALPSGQLGVSITGSTTVPPVRPLAGFRCLHGVPYDTFLYRLEPNSRGLPHVMSATGTQETGNAKDSNRLNVPESFYPRYSGTPYAVSPPSALYPSATHHIHEITSDHSKDDYRMGIDPSTGNVESSLPRSFFQSTIRTNATHDAVALDAPRRSAHREPLKHPELQSQPTYTAFGKPVKYPNDKGQLFLRGKPSEPPTHEYMMDTGHLSSTVYAAERIEPRRREPLPTLIFQQENEAYISTAWPSKELTNRNPKMDHSSNCAIPVTFSTVKTRSVKKESPPYPLPHPLTEDIGKKNANEDKHGLHCAPQEDRTVVHGHQKEQCAVRRLDTPQCEGVMVPFDSESYFPNSEIASAIIWHASTCAHLVAHVTYSSSDTFTQAKPRHRMVSDRTHALRKRETPIVKWTSSLKSMVAENITKMRLLNTSDAYNNPSHIHPILLNKQYKPFPKICPSANRNSPTCQFPAPSNCANLWCARIKQPRSCLSIE